MPIRTSNNNKILSGNARNADVASRAIQEILPTQQMRMQAAFRVQGYQGVLYNRLYQGIKCTCNASQKQLGARLDEEGKASPGLINELITGRTFDVSGYGTNGPRTNPFDSVVSPHAPKDKYQGVFDNVRTHPEALPTNIPFDGTGVGDNGPLELGFDINELTTDWDSTPGLNEASCGVCFGSNFVGGYSPLYGKRIVRDVAHLELASTDVIDAMAAPWTAESAGFTFTEVLPRGAVGLDSFRVMNGKKGVPANFTVDDERINAITVLKFCDGRPHKIGVEFAKPTVFTHVELQFATSADFAFFEFPRKMKGNDTSLLDSTDPFQIILSPLVPYVNNEDIFTETTTGKCLIVKNVNTWHTREAQTLGWEVDVRVVQPPEVYNAVPRRGRVKTKSETSNLVHDNSTGHRRT